MSGRWELETFGVGARATPFASLRSTRRQSQPAQSADFHRVRPSRTFLGDFFLNGLRHNHTLKQARLKF